RLLPLINLPSLPWRHACRDSCPRMLPPCRARRLHARTSMSDDLYIGLISGTSVDGIDAALVSFDQDRPSLVHSHLHHYPAALRQAVQALFVPGNDEIDRMGAVDVALGELFADAAMKLLEQAGVDAD